MLNRLLLIRATCAHPGPWGRSTLHCSRAQIFNASDILQGSAICRTHTQRHKIKRKRGRFRSRLSRRNRTPEVRKTWKRGYTTLVIGHAQRPLRSRAPGPGTCLGRNDSARHDAASGKCTFRTVSMLTVRVAYCRGQAHLYERPAPPARVCPRPIHYVQPRVLQPRVQKLVPAFGFRSGNEGKGHWQSEETSYVADCRHCVGGK